MSPAATVDTLVLARRKHPGGHNTLDDLCSRYGVDRSRRTQHGALLDAKLLAAVYVELTTTRQAALQLAASNQIFLVMDAGSRKAAFTTRRELQAYLRRRLDTFINPLVYTFWGNQGPSIMTLSSALAE
jgi:DNA polymerase III epsilon subunit-like protein